MAGVTVDLWVGALHARLQNAVIADGGRVVPVVESLMSSLTERYGKKQGSSIYYAMEAAGKGPFGEGGKYHKLHKAFAKKHGLAALGKRKAPRPKTRGRKRR